MSGFVIGSLLEISFGLGCALLFAGAMLTRRLQASQP
jgi:hypothetical protein